MNYANRFKQLRQQLNMNQSTFASALTISQAHISKIESDKDYPSDKLLNQIASTFEVNLNWLKTGSGQIWDEDKDTDEAYKDFSGLFMSIQTASNSLDINEKRNIFRILSVLKYLLQKNNCSASQQSLSIAAISDIFCYSYQYLIENLSENSKKSKINFELVWEGEREWRKICNESLDNLEQAFICNNK